MDKRDKLLLMTLLDLLNKKPKPEEIDAAYERQELALEKWNDDQPPVDIDDPRIIG